MRSGQKGHSWLGRRSSSSAPASAVCSLTPSAIRDELPRSGSNRTSQFRSIQSAPSGDRKRALKHSFRNSTGIRSPRVQRHHYVLPECCAHIKCFNRANHRRVRGRRNPTKSALVFEAETGPVLLTIGLLRILEPYIHAKGEIDSQFNELQQLIQDNPRQVEQPRPETLAGVAEMQFKDYCSVRVP